VCLTAASALRKGDLFPCYFGNTVARSKKTPYQCNSLILPLLYTEKEEEKRTLSWPLHNQHKQFQTIP
jgi:hypothetical protein